MSDNKQLRTNAFGDTEVYVITAYEWDPDRSRDEQAAERTCYCVCDSFETARRIIEHDTREGRITAPSIGSQVVQTVHHVEHG